MSTNASITNAELALELLKFGEDHGFKRDEDNTGHFTEAAIDKLEAELETALGIFQEKQEESEKEEV